MSTPRAEARDALAALFGVDSMPRILGDVGIDAARVDLRGPAIDVWQRIVDEAAKRGVLGELVRVARRDYPKHDQLAALELEILHEELQALRAGTGRNDRRARRIGRFQYAIAAVIVAIIGSVIALYQRAQALATHLQTRSYVVDSTGGWQRTELSVKKGDRIRLIADGRIHVGGPQVFNLINNQRGIVVYETLDRLERMAREQGTLGRDELDAKALLADIVHRKLVNPPNYESLIYYRNWVTPLGEPTPSDVFERCRYFLPGQWGELLVGFLERQADASDDPYAGVPAADESLRIVRYGAVHQLPDGEFRAPADGIVHLMVNDAVVSDRSATPLCRMYHQTLVDNVRSGEHHQHTFDTRVIPLINYTDNFGTLRVTLTTFGG